MKEKSSFLIKICFGKTNSPYYLKSVNKAKKFKNFTPISENSNYNTILIDRNELSEKNEQLEKLLLLVTNWKNTEIFLNDEAINDETYRQIILTVNCYKEYLKSVIPENHCKDYWKKKSWGCKFLNELTLEPENSYYQKKGWWEFGRFISKGIWEIDKEKLIEILKREANLKKLNICNTFDFEKVKNVVTNEIPNEIHIDESKNWVYKYEASGLGNLAEQRPIGIMYHNGYYENTQFIYEPENNKKPVKNRNIPNVKFADIGGIDNIIQTISEIIELPLKKPDLLEYLGVKAHKGILLYGPPGCGKTMIAKAIANDINAHFISIKGPEIISKWHGQSEENLRSIFNEAKELQPSIIYFDEIDSIAQKRSDEEFLRFDSKIVNQLLTLMDGVEDYGNICVIASTNRRDLLDEAILRPGRFDFEIEIKKPTLEGCYEIFSKHIKKMPIDKNFNIRNFSKKLRGLTGADIAFVAREGAYMCIRRSLDISKLLYEDAFKIESYSNLLVNQNDFEEALKKVKLEDLK